jgi:hypothetical protein
VTAQTARGTLVTVQLAVVVRMRHDTGFYRYVERSMQRP